MVNTGRVWIIGTTLLITFISYSPQLAGLTSGAPFWQFVLFNALVALVLYNYFQVVRTDPGRVPAGWQPSETRTADVRFCRKCENAKAPRAHHCRYCKRCVLRYDHHCPWVDNCIGHANYAMFLRFLLFVDLACSMHLYLVTTCVMNEERLGYPVTGFEIGILVANYVACIPVLICVGLFSLYHFWNMATNTTTIEGSEIERVKKMVKRGKIKPTSFPFDVGFHANVTSVVGASPSEWLWSGKCSGDGLSYPSKPGTDPLGWPPRDPYDTMKEAWAREAEVTRSRYPPYHPKYAAVDAEDDDDVPLAEIKTRSVRLRRGSEGFEVRPRFTAELSEEDAEGQSDWEELYERKQTVYDSQSDED